MCIGKALCLGIAVFFGLSVFVLLDAEDPMQALLNAAMCGVAVILGLTYKTKEAN